MQRERTIKSMRGKIYDCNGKLLATNEQTYGITLEDSVELTDNPSKNKMILKCIRLIEKNGDSLDLEFPITYKNGKFRFNVNSSAEMRFKRDIYYKKSVDELTAEQKNMTAKDCYDYIRTSQGANVINFFTAAKDTNKNGKIDAEEQAQADEDYSIEDALKIMTVRYAQLMNTYSKYEPITLSSNVSQRTVAAIKENSADMPGVEVSTELKRVYKDSKYFSHIIGYTGMISSETLENLKAEDPNTPYTSTDQIGKTGIEQEYEEQLRGSKGSQKLIIDSSSRVVETTKEKDAVAGTDIYLSIDSDLQKAVYKLAEKEIAGILTSKLVNGKSHGTKGHKASGILVPIYDVYDAILQNSIVDVTHFKDDKAIICGLAKIGEQCFTIIAEQKGRNTKENIERNFGMPNPESYRKAIRFMKQAEKFNRPVITFIDTKGAYPGIEAEERGQGEAIAKSMFEMAKLKVPIISVVIGEGSSGGALAIGIANKVFMLENAIYSILSPEGYSSILWKDPSRYKEAAEKMKLTSKDLYEMKIIDKIIEEPIEIDEENFIKISENIKKEIDKETNKMIKYSKQEIVQKRYEKFRNINNFMEI